MDSWMAVLKCYYGVLEWDVRRTDYVVVGVVDGGYEQPM